jgi:hypothetical protein
MLVKHLHRSMTGGAFQSGRMEASMEIRPAVKSMAKWLKNLAIVLAVILAHPWSTAAQDTASPKLTLFGGVGSHLSAGNSAGEAQLGASFDETPPGANFGILFEAGAAVPWSNLNSSSAILSVDYSAAWSLDKSQRFLPFATLGYSRLFGTGNAMNFGVGLDYRLSHIRAIRVEARDYWVPERSTHDVALRVGWVLYLQD